MAATFQHAPSRVSGKRAALAAAALLAGIGPGSGADARKPATPHVTRTAEDIPIPPTPPATPAAPAQPSAPSGAACSRQEASGKAAELLSLLQALIVRDPARARMLLDEFQQTVQREEQHQADLGQTCRAYDALIARATS